MSSTKFILPALLLLGALLITSLVYMLPRNYVETGSMWIEHNDSKQFFIRGTIDHLKVNSWKSNKIKIDYKKYITTNSASSAEKKMKNLIFDTYSLQDYTIFNPVALPEVKKTGVLNQLNLFDEIPTLSLEINLPEMCKFDIGISKGNISLENLNSDSKVSTEKGDITVKNTKGLFTIKTYRGDITGNYLQGEYKVLAKRGNINISHIQGIVSADAPAGRIEVQHYDKLIAQK